nr:hypothetical protein [Tanacetum cinerariifolium]
IPSIPSNLYKALVEAYDADKTILDSYGESAILKKRLEDDDDQEGPSAGSDRVSKRRRKGGEHASARTPSEPATGIPPRKPPTLDCDWNKTLPAVKRSAQSWISILAKQADARSSFNELLDTPISFSNFIMNRLDVDTLTPELLAGPTYKLMRGSCNSLTELEYHLEEVYKATTDQLDWVNPECQQYPHNLLQPLPLIPDNRGRRVILFEHFINNDLEYLRGDWISVRRDDDKIYKFKEGDLKRLRLQDIEDMLLLLVQGKLSNLTVEERFAFNVSLRMFTRSIVIQRRVEYLQLGVESYQKRLNLTKLDTYRSDLKRREAYTAYSNPRGFIYQNKEKKNRLMRIDELHKFGNGTLNDIRNALDDHLKGIRMQYLPTIIWRKGDKDRAAAMIQAIDKMLKTRRIMRSLESVEVLMYEKKEKSEKLGRVPTEMELILEHTQKGISYEVSGTLKGKWRYLIPAKPPIHNHVLIPNYQDFKIQDFRYSDGFECFQAIKIGSNWNVGMLGREVDNINLAMIRVSEFIDKASRLITVIEYNMNNLRIKQEIYPYISFGYEDLLRQLEEEVARESSRYRTEIVSSLEKLCKENGPCGKYAKQWKDLEEMEQDDSRRSDILSCFEGFTQRLDGLQKYAIDVCNEYAKKMK